MMSPGGQAEDLAIQRMAQPGQGMPVRGIPACKGPPDGLKRKAVGNVRIVDYVIVVVEADKLVAQ